MSLGSVTIYQGAARFSVEPPSSVITQPVIKPESVDPMAKITRHESIIGTQVIDATQSGTKYITLSGDATLVVVDPPQADLEYAIEVIMYISPGSHAVGFSPNIDWGDAGLPDFRANTTSVLTLTTTGNSTKWLGLQGNGGWS